MSGPLQTVTLAERSFALTIAINEATSNAFDKRGMGSLGLVMPSSFTGASITFTVSNDNSTFQALYDDNNTAVSVTVAASRSYALPPELAPWRYFKIVSASNEAAARTLTVMALSATPSSRRSTSVGGTVTVDSELPAAAALADNTATPTAPAVGAFGMVYDGATWDFMRGDAASGVTVNTELAAAAALADDTANPTIPGVGAFTMGFDGTTWDRIRTAGTTGAVQVAAGTAAAADGLGNSVTIPDSAGTARILASGPHAYNGATWDRNRNNTDITVLASAARTATTSSSDLTNYNGIGVVVVLNVTAFAATPTITLSIEGKDALSGSYYTIFTAAAINVSGTSTNAYTLYPGATVAANVTLSYPLPRTWRVTVTHGDTDSATYSVGASVLL